MKKIVILALGIAAIGSANAQKANVDAAKKLLGKVDKVEEARNAIKSAISNPETSAQAATYMMAADVELRAFDDMKKKMGLNAANFADADKVQMDNFLLNGYPYLLQTIEVSATDPKGAKAQGEAVKKLTSYLDDFFQAGADLYGAKQYYPGAYQAFMAYGDIPAIPVMAGKVNVPDSVRSTSYFNAGLSGWAASNLPEAAKAFKKAAETGYDKPEAYIYGLACWQNMMQNDSTITRKGQEEIYNISQTAYDRFGLSQPVFLNNMINVLVEQNRYEDAVAKLSQLIESNPGAALYGLRGYVYDRMDNDAASEKDYRTAAGMPDADFETLKNAGKKIFRLGTERWNKIEGTSEAANAERKNVRENYFMVAKDIATRAQKSLAEGQNPGDLDYLIESVDYALESLR